MRKVDTETATKAMLEALKAFQIAFTALDEVAAPAGQANCDLQDSALVQTRELVRIAKQALADWNQTPNLPEIYPCTRFDAHGPEDCDLYTLDFVLLDAGMKCHKSLCPKCQEREDAFEERVDTIKKS